MRQTIGNRLHDTERGTLVATLVYECRNHRTTSTVTTSVYFDRGEFFLRHEGSPRLPQRFGVRGNEATEVLDLMEFGDLYHRDDWSVANCAKWKALQELMQEFGPPRPGSRAVDVGC